ncbi:MAG: sulfurtransferase [Betaproteobacteria bacterium]|jgi:thiosulfate/3-mercaptopyruvate sulfurtransferase
MTQGFARPEFLVETDWLATHLEDPSVRVLDCTTHLPALPDNSYYTVRPGREDFLQSHIPGAAFVDMDDAVADTTAPFHFMLPSATRFAQAMSALGIDRDTLVVSYSAANHWWASRMWWMLRVFGHDRAAVLNGGFQKWRKEGRGTESGTPRPRAAAHFEARPARREMVATREDVLTAIGDADTCTVNALRPDQHAGTGGVYYGRRGHIKGSVNLAAAATVDDGGVYRSAQDLRRMFAVALSKPAIITYCGGGIAATADTLVLTMLGHDNVKLYDASLSEWARDPALPMET